MAAIDTSALDRLPCGWLRMDASGVVSAVNGCLCRMLGTDPKRLQGRSFDSLLTRPSQVLYQSYLQPLLRLHGQIEEFALVFDLGAGHTLDALVYSTPTAVAPSEGPDAQHIELVVASMRKRRGIEDELLRIKRAADHAPGMMFQLMQVGDGRCHFSYTSEAIRRMYGVTSQQARQSSETLLGLLDPDTRAELAASLAEAGRSSRDWHASFEIRIPGEPPRWHEVHATPRRLADGVILWHGHCADVTDKRALELARNEARSMAEMHAARNEFLARVSHELRTPLNGILGFAQLLAADKAQNLNALQQDRLALLTASSRHLLTLVNEVLEISSIDSGAIQVELDSLPLRPALLASMQAMRGQAEAAQVRMLEPDCDDGLWVQSNHQRLQQVLVNLLSNAIKYNRVDGTVHLQARREADGVKLSVIDTGKGLSEQQRAALFQPFNRLGAERSGVLGHGLGLVISKQLLNIMGASLSVDSTPGRGSRFEILMPAGEGCAADAPHGLSGAQVSAGTDPAAAAVRDSVRGHVLYVEDDEVNAILMSAILGMRPRLKLQVATTGQQALEMARQGGINLMLIDMHLPDTNGIDLLAALRKSRGLESVPAVMVSAGARKDDIELALARGFQGYWTKPLDIDQVLDRLDDLLQGASAY